MDWNSKIASAKRMIADKGIAMTICKIVPGTYNATSDSISATLTSYSTIGVITNPVVRNTDGEYSRSDSVRLILPASGLPTLDRIAYKVVCGEDTWFPKSTRAVKPGGVVIIYLADLK
jgi:hypothetical protein